ncbi:hypothetical protein ET445_03420 [Agromyces protaetiae]|uniref:Uncharacterized protein n=1 Tax=Agromyces protaetiae TaxID=2509455 RepID=A0A4V0YGV5_9MICO|nr:hypothetical protein [Agromyces protaetiae]QAY72531.1 hypothetical protein ET445_03420 [Agromyces protaetiae]
MHEERGARVARGAAVAGVATFVASLAHTLGGGLAPGPLAVALALAFSVPFSILAVGGKRFRLARAGFAAVAAQLALHTLYSLGSGVPGTGAGSVVMQQADASGSALHEHHAAVTSWASTMPTMGTPSLHAADHVDHFGPWMLVAHAVAALATIGVIWLTVHAVSVLAAAARGIRIAFALVTATLAPHPLAARADAFDRAAPSLRDRHLLSWRHRGPPLVLAAA